MTISYDGSFFHGFQRQTKYISVQEVLEEKLSEILKLDITVHGSGRTDAGVHAKGQVIHFDSSQYVPPLNLMKILNKKVYPHIYVTSSEIVDESFHSRKSAISKEYRYYVSINTFDPLKVNYMHFFHDRIDISKIREAMKYIVGTHDFKSFSKNKTVKTTVRTIEEFELNIIDGVLEFRIKGTGFMYNMVRIIIAIMLKVAEGKLQPSDVLRIIDGKERTLAPWVAPASGLYLWKVYYE
jgi:tRNA pseudouridine38-40 synthase